MNPTQPPHTADAPSAWVQRWSHLVPAGGTVLDLACGQGRHVRWFSQRGHRVTAVDRSPEALQAVATLTQGVSVTSVLADLEQGPWPFADQAFDAVVVTNYLWRSLLPVMVQSVAPGGVLIYETFAIDHARIGRPSRPDFLLQPGELLRSCGGLRVIAYEDGFLTDPERFVQRIAAVRAPGGSPDTPPRRHLL